MSKTKVTIEYAVKYPDGRMKKALDTDDACRMVKDSGGRALIMSRVKTVTKTEWQL